MVSRQRLSALFAVLCLVIATTSCTSGKTADADDSPADCPDGAVVGWGDSLTYSATKVDGEWRQASPTWLDVIGQQLDVKTENFGVSSQGSAEIAVRQGGLRPVVTLGGNQIPSGSTAAIAVTDIRPADGWTQYEKAGTMRMRGTLAGIEGTLEHTKTPESDSFAFVPDSASEQAVPVPPNSTFVGTDGDRYKSCFQTVWAGTNNGKQRGAIMRDIASMVDFIPNPRRYLIIGTIPALKNELAMTYGARFVDLRSWLISDGLSAAGIAPTPEDSEAVASGQMPPSLTVDGTHFTQAGYDAIGHHLATIIKDAR